ncbi:MAG: hypothetical protein R3F07_04655 [Opitutaceae bacterium]
MISSKGKGIFLELNEQSLFVARTSGFNPPLTIESVREFSLDDRAVLADEFRQFAGTRQGAYVASRCGVFPKGRVVSRTSLDPKKARESTYLQDLLASQLKIDLKEFLLYLLAAADGSDSGGDRGLPREAIVCGAPQTEIQSIQDSLLEVGVFPDRLELGTVASLGGIIHYLKCQSEAPPTLVLEISADTTNVFVVNKDGVDISRPVAYGISSMIPVIQKELGLKDEESARRLFYSNSFDFTGLGPQLIKKLVRELQASVGFYEVQTGQTIGQLYCAHLPAKLAWLQKTVSDMLGVRVLTMDFRSWLKELGITLASTVEEENVDSTWLGLISLMGDFTPEVDEKN